MILISATLGHTQGKNFKEQAVLCGLSRVALLNPTKSNTRHIFEILGSKNIYSKNIFCNAKVGHIIKIE